MDSLDSKKRRPLLLFQGCRHEGYLLFLVLIFILNSRDWPETQSQNKITCLRNHKIRNQVYNKELCHKAYWLGFLFSAALHSIEGRSGEISDRPKWKIKGDSIRFISGLWVLSLFSQCIVLFRPRVYWFAIISSGCYWFVKFKCTWFISLCPQC